MTAETPDVARRGWIAGSLGLLAGAVGLRRNAAANDCSGAAADAPVPQGKVLAKWGMAIDLDLCTGCGACVVACKAENNVPMSGHEPDAHGTGISWMDILPKAAVEPGSDSPELLPMPCMHCEDAPCVKVCPVNATYINEEGLVAQVWDRCIGCRYCMVACPYSRRFFNWKEPGLPESFRSLLNPDVATRPEGVVEKCTFCHHRIRKLREEARVAERPLADGDFRRLTACAEVCPAVAITFGDLNDPASRVAELHKSPRASRLLEELGAKPKVVYLARERRHDE